ncbi:SagB/ThcOx family dehydrogenase [Paenibacillus alkalitolerans]|uniref:SagB/ThcOx family dehydrogenase n=1 Tax=Paenibacillus alkalitolerans TaxID=2799335 RepID=UPI0018F6DCB3|nr:SagB/ThcOx family dehydrogenase [Paenibacillus alkalitolerans]
MKSEKELVYEYHRLSSWDSLLNHPNTTSSKSLFEVEQNIEINDARLSKIYLDYKKIPEQCISDLVSQRNSAKEMVQLEDINILELGTFLKWSVGNKLNEQSKKMYPSAGAIYPNKIFLVVKNVENIDSGFYFYNSNVHSLIKISNDDTFEDALLQEGINSNVCCIIASHFESSEAKYGLRGYRFCLLEAGHIAQNMLLLANAMGWSAAPIGGFKDEVINKKLNNKLKAIYLIPIGKQAN